MAVYNFFNVGLASPQTYGNQRLGFRHPLDTAMKLWSTTER